MKKIISTAILSVFIAFNSFSLNAIAKDLSIGKVNVGKIAEVMLKEPYMKAQKDVEAKYNAEKSFTNKKSKEIEAARKKNISQAELEKMMKAILEQRNKIRKSAMDFEKAKQKELNDLQLKMTEKVKEAIEQVSKDKKYDYVINDQGILYGGKDITEDVIK